MSPRSSTRLPARPRRPRGGGWTQLVARVFCTVFALIGVLPIAVTVLARSAMLNAWAAKKSSQLLTQQGLHAKYRIDVKLVPLALELTDVVLDSTDGKGPALTSDRISARPRIFALLAGKLVIDQIENDEPAIRLVFKDGDFQNLPIKLPRGPGGKKPLIAPFSVFAVTGASVDIWADAAHLVAKDIDVDLTTDESGAEGSSFEIATRIGQTVFSRPRVYRPWKSAVDATAYDDDALCSLDARVRYEPHAILVRRFSAQGKLPVTAVSHEDTHVTETGTLSLIDNTVDTQTGTIHLKATFDNARRTLWPGQFVDVALTLSTSEGAIVIPAEAVQAGQEGQMVYVVGKDDTVLPRPVSVGRNLENKVVIDKGLAQGEKVVTDGQMMLFPGAHVTVAAAPKGPSGADATPKGGSGVL